MGVVEACQGVFMLYLGCRNPVFHRFVGTHWTESVSTITVSDVRLKGETHSREAYVNPLNFE